MQKIYHYTSFETFKKIIKNGVIRFNSLSNVDDAEEGYLTDCQSQAKYFFVSCWTKNIKESIPLWSMYVQSNFAIRIGINPDFLKPKLVKRYLIQNQKSRNAYVTLMHRKGKLKDNFFHEIFYEDDAIMSQSKNIRGIYNPKYIEKYAIIKNTNWSFQEEVRYIIQAVLVNSVKERADSSLYNSIQESIINNDFTNLEYIDMEYSKEYMENADFILGPSTTEDDKKEFKNFIKKNINNYTGKITRSQNHIRQKPYNKT